jgi:hypothetical protein
MRVQTQVSEGDTAVSVVIETPVPETERLEVTNVLGETVIEEQTNHEAQRAIGRAAAHNAADAALLAFYGPAGVEF